MSMNVEEEQKKLIVVAKIENRHFLECATLKVIAIITFKMYCPRTEHSDLVRLLKLLISRLSLSLLC